MGRPHIVDFARQTPTHGRRGVHPMKEKKEKLLNIYKIKGGVCDDLLTRRHHGLYTLSTVGFRLQRPLDHETCRLPENYMSKTSPDLLQIWDISTRIPVTQPTTSTRDDTTITTFDEPMWQDPHASQHSVTSL